MTATVTFEMNGKAYRTDAATLDVLRGIVPAAKAANDFSAVAIIMDLGLATGRIVETGLA
jgi:hypothetical protein